MVEQVNFGMGSGGILKVVKIFRLAAVIDQNNVGKTVFQQTVDDSVQLFVRIQGGQDYGDLG